MKLNQFNGRKALALIIFGIVLLISYHILVKTCSLLHRVPNGTTNFTATATATAEGNTNNEVTTVNRIKRFLIFQGGGVVKLVLGTSFPIKMADKRRSLNYFYNFQMQYAPPTIPLYWWSIYNTSTFAARKQSVEKLMRFDNSRDFVYELIKTTLARNILSAGNSANECLLNIICQLGRAPFLEDFNSKPEEAAQQNIDDGDREDDCGRNIYHKLINTIFTPVKEPYLNARKAGQNGADCDETFGKCYIAERLFNKYTYAI